MSEQDERRRALGIPIHVSEEDHDWRDDHYCNCGASKKKQQMKAHGNRVTGKNNLDVIEGNSEANF